MSQLAGRDIQSFPFSCCTDCTNRILSRNSPPLKLSICRNEKMEAGCFIAVDMDEAMDSRPCGTVDSGARGTSCLSRPETQEGCAAATPPLFEEPYWSSCGQDEASKLFRKNKKSDLISTV